MKMKVTSIGLMAALAVSVGCHKAPPIDNKDLKDFEVVNLVANTAEYNPKRIDPTLQNGFGIAWAPSGIAWVNSVLGRVSELYRANGDSVRPGVKIPSRTGPDGGLPCGIVFNGEAGFTLSNGKPAAFIFSSFDGVLSAWNGGDNAQRIKAPEGASYTGLAIGSYNGRRLIYAANFGQKKIDVWDTSFHKVNLPFYDAAIPSAYSPYNIQAVGDYLFVIYGQLATDRDPNPGHGVAGLGKGFVDVFGTDGKLVKHFASYGKLNLPWGVTAAPASFLNGKDLSGGEVPYISKSYNGGGGGQGGNDNQDPVILVGNFGDGHINVFTDDGKFLGQLQTHKHVLEIEGLWALTFPPATANIDPGQLYFSAGPENEADGVFGFIKKQ